jgi:hypothetical protein
MITNEVVLWVVLGVLGLANVVVSVLVIRSRYYSWPQKLVQCAIVWAVPILGPTGIWAFLRSQEHADVFDTRAYPEPSQKMVAVEIQNAIHDSFGDGAGGGGEGGGSD